MSTNFKWREPLRAPAGTNLDARVADIVRREVSSSGVRQFLTPDTIPIGTIDRAGFSIVYTAGSNYSITATSFAEVDAANLAGTLVASGAPIRVDFSAIVSKGTSNIRLSVSVNGVEPTGATFGLGMATVTGSLSGFYVIDKPTPGQVRIALMAAVDAGTGSISAGADSRVLLSAREV